jgi:hypothetical protein
LAAIALAFGRRVDGIGRGPLPIGVGLDRAVGGRERQHLPVTRLDLQRAPAGPEPPLKLTDASSESFVAL